MQRYNQFRRFSHSSPLNSSLNLMCLTSFWLFFKSRMECFDISRSLKKNYRCPCLWIALTRFCQITLRGIKKSIKISLKVKMLVTQSRPALHPRGFWPARLFCLWDSPGKNTGVGSHSLLWWIFPTRGWNPSLLHCRQIVYCLSHQNKLGFILIL